MTPVSVVVGIGFDGVELGRYEVQPVLRGKHLAVTPEVDWTGKPRDNGLFKVTHIATGYSVVPTPLPKADATKVYRALSRVPALRTLTTPPVAESHEYVELLASVRAAVAKLNLGDLV